MQATEEQRQIVLNSCGVPLLQAAINIDFAARYQVLLARFPENERYYQPEHYVALARKQEIVQEVSQAAGMPMRYFKTEGGWWALAKNYHRSDIRIALEMCQWVSFGFRVTPPATHYGGGGGFKDIWNAQRLHEGAVLEFQRDIQTPHSPWCYTEEDFYTVLTAGFELFQDLEAQLPQGSTEGWRLKPEG